MFWFSRWVLWSSLRCLRGGEDRARSICLLLLSEQLRGNLRCAYRCLLREAIIIELGSNVLEGQAEVDLEL